MIEIMSTRYFGSVCRKKKDILYSGLFQNTGKLIQERVPLKASHRQKMPTWVFPSTSNLIDKTKTQKKELLERPTVYLRQIIFNLEKVVSENSEFDRLNYQE